MFHTIFLGVPFKILVLELYPKSSETRKAIWANVLFHIANSNYIIGSGTSFSSEFLSPILDDYKLFRDNLASHSTILKLLLELG